jgi:hypothetical protein
MIYRVVETCNDWQKYAERITERTSVRRNQSQKVVMQMVS